MYIQLREHSSKNNILTEEHFDFRMKSTTSNTMYELNNVILNALNNKLIIGGIFCHLEKAFDCVNLKILLSKLEFYCVKGKAMLWLESCFRNGCQRILITNNELNHNDFSTQNSPPEIWQTFSGELCGALSLILPFPFK
jgi:hypothetical protein